jgi:hypothetical protein
MQSQRSSSRIGAILSLLGGALVIYGMFFLPMVFGTAGGGGSEPTSEWTVATAIGLGGVVLVVLVALPVLFVLGTSAASFFRRLSPEMVTLRRSAAIVGLIIQVPVGFGGAILYTFTSPPGLGAGYWLVLLGFIVMSVGTFLK